MNSFATVLLLASVLVSSTHAGSIRNKRGYLSRTGLCPDPAKNFQRKENRLNYLGFSMYQSDEPIIPPCLAGECDEDSECDGDRKCCKNSCGANVCTVSMRDPDPCSNFHCPGAQTCKIQKVQCVMPECAAAIAINRPTCIPRETFHTLNSETLGDFQPDTSEALLKAAAAQQNDAAAAAQTDAMQAPPIENAAGPFSNDALSYADQQQAYASPVDPSSMSSAPVDLTGVVQTPMDTANYAPISNSDMGSFEAPPAPSSFMADQPSPDLQAVAQAPVMKSSL